MTNTPSDAEIEALAAEHLKAFAQFTGAGDVWVEGEVAFARAVLAKWGTPQPADCTRSHPHEEMDGYCLLRTEIARLTNENARLKASQPAREPLTVQEVEQILAQWSYELHGDRARYLVRMTEAAHGITQKGGD